MTAATYMTALNGAALLSEFPIGDAFLAHGRSLSRDELYQRQNVMFRRCVARAWAIRFYQRLWGNAGAQPGDIQRLDDLPRLPVFD
jgi:phenylacetate-CoA ligase